MLQEICAAIQARRLIRFYYSGDDAPGIRLVEPHMLAYTTKDNLALSAWFLGGASESAEGQDWRDYLIDNMSDLEVLPQKFDGPRLGYNPTGGKKFHNIRCAL